MVLDLRKILLFVLILGLLVVLHEKILTAVGNFLVVEDIPPKAEAAVVLYTGVDIYPRLIEAADLYRQGKVEKIVIDGNRKSESLRELEKNGYEPHCKWYAEELGVLNHLDVSKDDIVAISGEDAYDTITEARIVGKILINIGMSNIVISTSKYHSRRARHIWHEMYKGRLKIYVAPAQRDTFQPNAWWRSGRQIRWVLSEYGAWVYYYWMDILPDLSSR